MSLPKGWHKISIAQLGNFDKNCVQTGPFGAQLHSSDYKSTGTPLLLIRNITENGLNVNDLPKISLEDAKRLSKYALSVDDIVFSRVGRVGSCFLVTNNEKGWIISGQLLRIRIKNKNLNHKYLTYFLKSNRVQDYLKGSSVGSTRESINTTILEKLIVDLPPLPEQQKIAEILSTVDEKIEVIEAQINQTTELKKGLMQQLLTKGIGHTKFKDSPLGKIPKCWDCKYFEDIALNVSTKYKERNGKCVELEHLEQNTGKLIGYDDYENKSSLKTHFQKSDILFGKLRPYLRKFWYSEFEGCCTTELMVFRSKDNVDSKFLFYLVQLESFILHSVSKSFGTKMPRTSWAIIKKYYLALPPLKEQRKISSILSLIDDKLICLTSKKERFENFKKGLMQQLLTGKLRVNLNSNTHAAKSGELQPTS
jgi:restriction endonuclease S subunit